jgi:hypothetical protein
VTFTDVIGAGFVAEVVDVLNERLVVVRLGALIG